MVRSAILCTFIVRASFSGFIRPLFSYLYCTQSESRIARKAVFLLEGRTFGRIGLSSWYRDVSMSIL